MASTLELLNAAELAFWANKPTASMYNNTTVSVTTATETAITWNSEVDDNWNGHSVSVNTSRYTAQVAGVYRFSGSAAFQANATGYRLAQLYYNGTEFNGNCRVYVPAFSSSIIASATLPATTIRMVVGDYVELYAYQTSGIGLTLSPDGTWFNVEFSHF